MIRLFDIKLFLRDLCENIFGRFVNNGCFRRLGNGDLIAFRELRLVDKVFQLFLCFWKEKGMNIFIVYYL